MLDRSRMLCTPPVRGLLNFLSPNENEETEGGRGGLDTCFSNGGTIVEF